MRLWRFDVASDDDDDDDDDYNNNNNNNTYLSIHVNARYFCRFDQNFDFPSQIFLKAPNI
jgi:hypothetical protein